jgi:hypothetical protein
MTVFDLFVKYSSSGSLYSTDNQGKSFRFDIREEYEEPLILRDLGFETLSIQQNAFVDYKKIEPFLLPVTIVGDWKYEFEARNPFVCMRGECLNPCNDEDTEGYSFICEDFCHFGLIDGNDGISRFPTLFDVLLDVVHWHLRCPDVDAIIYIPEFYPYKMKHLDYDNAFGLIQIKRNQVSIVFDKAEAERIYKEYEKSYPSADYLLVEGVAHKDFRF